MKTLLVVVILFCKWILELDLPSFYFSASFLAACFITLFIILQRKDEKKKWFAVLDCLVLDQDIKHPLKALSHTSQRFRDYKVREAFAFQHQRYEGARLEEERLNKEESIRQYIREAMEKRGQPTWQYALDYYAVRKHIKDGTVPSDQTLDLLADIIKNKGVYLGMSPDHVHVMFGTPQHSPIRVRKTKTNLTNTYYKKGGEILRKFEFEDGALVEYVL